MRPQKKNAVALCRRRDRLCRPSMGTASRIHAVHQDSPTRDDPPLPHRGHRRGVASEKFEALLRDSIYVQLGLSNHIYFGFGVASCVMKLEIVRSPKIRFAITFLSLMDLTK